MFETNTFFNVYIYEEKLLSMGTNTTHQLWAQQIRI
jgi:hypothetical protein